MESTENWLFVRLDDRNGRNDAIITSSVLLDFLRAFVVRIQLHHTRKGCFDLN